jgi:integrase/recombinase XerD
MMLSELIEQYVAFRKSLGEIQGSSAVTLRSFGRSLGTDTDIADVRPEHVDAFLAGKGPFTSSWYTKLSVLRAFYRYAISRGHTTAAPLPTVIPKRPPAFVPYIFSQDDLRRLLQEIDTGTPRSRCMAPKTIRTILLLMYGAGLRIREVVSLNRGDVDLAASVLTVRQTKFGKTLQHNYRIICGRAGINRTDGASLQPRMHDLRHSFAVHRLTSWYRQGADVQKLLPHLSVYMGHVHIRHTQVYLSMTPELLQQAGQRFEHYAITEAAYD